MGSSTAFFEVAADAATGAFANWFVLNRKRGFVLKPRVAADAATLGLATFVFNRNVVASSVRNPIRGWKTPPIVPKVAATATLGWRAQPPCGYVSACSELWRHPLGDRRTNTHQDVC